MIRINPDLTLYWPIDLFIYFYIHILLSKGKYSETFSLYPFIQIFINDIC